MLQNVSLRLAALGNGVFFAREMKYNTIKQKYAEWSVDRSILGARSICLWVLSGSPMTDLAHHWNIAPVENPGILARPRFMDVNVLR